MTKPARKPPAIKPCPFCGSRSLEIAATMIETWVLCFSCRARAGASPKREDALANWNRRTPEKP